MDSERAVLGAPLRLWLWRVQGLATGGVLLCSPGVEYVLWIWCPRVRAGSALGRGAHGAAVEVNDSRY